MSLTLLVGGARSGKSSLAQRIAARTDAPVHVIATARADEGDAEMVDRISRHRADRPSGWLTVEEPVDLLRAIREIPDRDTVIVDCLTLWLTSLLLFEAMSEDRILEVAARTAAAAASRDGLSIAVTNEVGMGIVPEHAVSRAFRDLSGRTTRIWADHADRAGLVVAGRILDLQHPNEWTP